MFRFWKNKEQSKDKIKINVEKLKFFLGGEKNIVGTEYTSIKVKIFVVSSKDIDVEKIEKMRGITGLFVSRSYITIIVGKQAKELASLLVKIKKV